MHGLVSDLAQRHDVTAVTLIDDEFDIEECRQAMPRYCRDVIAVPNPIGQKGLAKRLRQVRSLASTNSFERLRVKIPVLQHTLDRVLQSERFDVVNLEFPYLGHLDLRQAPPGERRPPLILDSHEIAHELERQFARKSSGLSRRLYASINWPKLKREELAAYGSADGVYLCSALDEQRLLSSVPKARTAVIPNAADIDYFQPDGSPGDGRTVVYFGLLSTVPNIDGVLHFVSDIWPRIAKAHPLARCKIVGGSSPPSLLALAGPRIEFTGFVSDLRPHLAAAAALVVPLRLGGGTRLKIVEGLAMGQAIVSTTLGAEGIDAVPGRDLLIEDDPEGFACAVNALLADPSLAARIGQSGRRLAVERYSWSNAARSLEAFYLSILEGRT
jgi:glycosyltransferase involved in cell wall biosynthesis